jgi:hypothetical protein
MILLACDCLLFELPSGETVPFSAEMISVEISNGTGGMLEQEFVEHAAASVFHYFKNDLGRKSVSVAEFASAFESVLNGLGLKLTGGRLTTTAVGKSTKDLRLLAHDAGYACELGFFPLLRDAVRDQYQSSPEMVRFHGLRGCVKRLAGAQRWGPRCDTLRDQIIEFLRHTVSLEAAGRDCGLMVE